MIFKLKKNKITIWNRVWKNELNNKKAIFCKIFKILNINKNIFFEYFFEIK